LRAGSRAGGLGIRKIILNWIADHHVLRMLIEGHAGSHEQAARIQTGTQQSWPQYSPSLLRFVMRFLLHWMLHFPPQINREDSLEMVDGT
jgi:hypothetical protein